MRISAKIYRGTDADLTLPINILKAEGICWEIADDLSQMMKLSKGRTSPSIGWLVWFPHYNDGAVNWTGLYHLLSKRGLLRC